MAPKEAAPIPPSVQRVGGDFSLGVDIHGLAALATKLYGYVPPSEDVVQDIEASVKRVIRDAGWKGEDANAFEDAWSADASDARRLTMFIEDAGKIIDDLASSLAELQMAANNRRLEAQKNDRSYNPELALLQDAQDKAEKLQREAAQRLVALYSGKDGSWSVLAAAQARSKDENVPKNLQNRLGNVEDDLDDALPDDGFNAGFFFGGIATGMGIGAGIGAVVGGIGAGPGTAIGGVIGGVAGGGKWALDQIDDLF